MNIFKHIAAVVVSGALVLGLGSCKSNNYEEPISNFKVVKTEFASSAKGGEGLIVLSEGGFEVSAQDTWVKPSKSGDKEVKLVIEPNVSVDARVTNVVLKKAQDVLTVTITQLGVVNFIPNVETQSIRRSGGTFEIDLTQLADEPQITVTPESAWLTHRLENGKLLWTVAPNANEQPARQARVSIQAGLASVEFDVNQIRGLNPAVDLLTEEVAGTYTMSYVNPVNGSSLNVNIRVAPHTESNQFVVSGLAQPFIVEFDEDAAHLIFKTGATLVRPSTALPDDRYLLLAISEDRESVGAGNGYQLVGAWDKVNKRAPKFTFTPENSGYPNFGMFLLRSGNYSLVTSQPVRPNLFRNVVIQRTGN